MSDPAVQPGRVSLWLCSERLDGVADGFLDGSPEILSWLFVDFGVAIDGAFATNYTASRAPAPVGQLLDELVDGDVFGPSAAQDACDAGMGSASFVLALYDYAYDPAAHELEPHAGTPYLRFLGVYDRG
jgi:hypothetical protein